jgi:hypothetical protein
MHMISGLIWNSSKSTVQRPRRQRITEAFESSDNVQSWKFQDKGYEKDAMDTWNKFQQED